MRAPRATAVIALAGVALGAAALAGCADSTSAHAHRSSGRAPTASAGPATAHERRWMLGRSVRGRAIVAYELGDPTAPRKALIVGCIHGNEPAGTTVVAALRAGGPIAGTDLWLIPTINPDGQAAGTRQNAHGVDLNRNFPFDWKPLGPRGTQQYAGPGPISEPESRIAHALIARLRPKLTIWFHQPLGVVDESGGSLAVERRFAQLARLPLRRLVRYPGSAAGWQDHRFRGTSAFVVELPPGHPAPSEVQRWAGAVRAVAAR
jgi:protein MpaA